MEIVVSARSSMHAASIARGQCTQPVDLDRKVRVILNGKASCEPRASAHNAKQPHYDHFWRQIHDWELARNPQCRVSMVRGAETVSASVLAKSVMEATGLAILKFQEEKLPISTLSLEIGKNRPVPVDVAEYWRWLLTESGPDQTKAYLRDQHRIPLTREEKRAKKER